MNSYDLQPLVKAFNAHADREMALKMNAYMKGQFNYLGLPSTLRRELAKQFYEAYGYPHPAQVKDVAERCWEMPEREYKYFAMELMVKLRKKTGHDMIHFYEKLLGIDSWWDSIDLIAPSLVGYHMQQYPEERQGYVDKWLASGNIWLQRSSILFQLKYKMDTDTRMLADIILKLKDSKEFFIRKAIGWSLREYSKTDPDFVLQFVAKNELSGLSRREALKWIEKQ